MANIKSLSDLNGEDGDDKGKFNDYYAGGEKRYVCYGGCTCETCCFVCSVLQLITGPLTLALYPLYAVAS